MADDSRMGRPGTENPSGETDRQRPASGSTIDPRVIAEKVYRLMQQDLNVERERTTRQRG